MTDIETNNSLKQGLVPPSIRIAEDEMHRLSALSNSCMELFPRVAQFLSREMERATVVADARDLPGVVRMGSKVTYREDPMGATREVTLVYPHEADIALDSDPSRSSPDRSVGGTADRVSDAWQRDTVHYRARRIQSVTRAETSPMFGGK